MSILVDSSVWIDYFRGGNRDDDRLEWLIDEGLVAINDLILAELLPPLVVRRQNRLVSLLRDIPVLPLEIDWPGIINSQTVCLRNGVNKIGIPDLIIAQHAVRHAVPVFSHDKHFRLLALHLGIELF